MLFIISQGYTKTRLLEKCKASRAKFVTVAVNHTNLHISTNLPEQVEYISQNGDNCLSTLLQN